MNLYEIGAAAKEAAGELNKLGVSSKNEGLMAVAAAFRDEGNIDMILKANELDIANARANNMKESLVDRLSLNKERIEGMAEGVDTIIKLDDPVGEIMEMKERPNGLLIGKKRVPIGVIGIIYESRPNVTSDAFSLCFKTGNAVILRGGSDAIDSNISRSCAGRPGRFGPA